MQEKFLRDPGQGCQTFKHTSEDQFKIIKNLVSENCNIAETALRLANEASNDPHKERKFRLTAFGRYQYAYDLLTSKENFTNSCYEKDRKLWISDCLLAVKLQHQICEIALHVYNSDFNNFGFDNQLAYDAAIQHLNSRNECLSFAGDQLFIIDSDAELPPHTLRELTDAYNMIRREYAEVLENRTLALQEYELAHQNIESYQASTGVSADTYLKTACEHYKNALKHISININKTWSKNNLDLCIEDVLLTIDILLRKSDIEIDNSSIETIEKCFTYLDEQWSLLTASLLPSGRLKELQDKKDQLQQDRVNLHASIASQEQDIFIEYHKCANRNYRLGLLAEKDSQQEIAYQYYQKGYEYLNHNIAHFCDQKNPPSLLELIETHLNAAILQFRMLNLESKENNHASKVKEHLDVIRNNWKELNNGDFSKKIIEPIRALYNKVFFNFRDYNNKKNSCSKSVSNENDDFNANQAPTRQHLSNCM